MPDTNNDSGGKLIINNESLKSPVASWMKPVMRGPSEVPKEVTIIVNDKATAISLGLIPGKRKGTVINMGKKAQENPLKNEIAINTGIEPVNNIAAYVPAISVPKTTRKYFSMDLRAAAIPTPSPPRPPTKTPNARIAPDHLSDTW